MHTCKKCSQDKSTSEMSLWGGELSEICLDCRAAMKAARSNGRGDDTRKKRQNAVNGKKASTADLALTLPTGGFGVNASITEEGYLQLTQANEGAESDNICLTRHEAKAIFDKFGEWIVES